jgi:hypothetical protein
MDEDLDVLTHGALLAVAKELRAAIRTHRDASGHALCWHHPDMWALLPDKRPPSVVVPAWPQFIQGCVAYRQSLDAQVPDAPRSDEPFER